MAIPPAASSSGSAASAASQSAGTSAAASQDAAGAPPSPSSGQSNRARAHQLRSNIVAFSRRRNGPNAAQPNDHANPTEEEREPSAVPDAAPAVPLVDQNAQFVQSMERLQHDANQVTMSNAQLSNTKSLTDAHAKLLRGNGESVKDMAPR